SVGENTFYIRTWDNACNVSSTYVTAILKYNADAPSAPQNLVATPTSNSINSFSFSWDIPNDFQGAESGLSYCYTINTQPSASTCTFTSNNSLSADAYATQPQVNTFYLVTKDEAGNINYSDYASVDFTADTLAPGLPRNIDVSDVSIKNTENWKLAISWDEPENVGSGPGDAEVDHYAVYRSIEATSCSDSFSDFNEIGSIAGTTYVDTNLDQQNYYYCVKACDSTNNCSATSETSTGYPDGKFTEPAELIAQPTISGLTTKKATISWATDRTSDSKIAFGTESETYFEEEPSNSDQVIEHSITLNNLNPGTTYYYVAKWTDEDGNTGISDELLFTTDPAPTVKDVTISSIGLNNAVIKYTTVSATKAKIYYGPTTAFGGASETTTSPAESTYTTILDSLTDGTKYNFKINTFDTDGYEYEGTILDFTTIARPQISDVRVQQIVGTAQTAILVTWNSNTEISSIVDYYPTDTPTANRTEVDVNRVSGEHRSIVSGLLAQTPYSLVVRGIDGYGNEATSDIQSFTTATDTRPPKITNLKVDSSVVSTEGSQPSAQVVVTWDTDEPTTSQIEFAEGTGTTYSQKTLEDSNLTSNHLVVISGLSPSKVYHLRAVSQDSAGNIGTSVDTVTITPKATTNALDLVIGNLREVFGFLGDL
ncbi:fibronectin type III domain-containing protein, partial [candidate division WWE3 bacterium]|nr:fibronectin type III domain-containing protein [candidate division WWE3 bacterium]